MTFLFGLTIGAAIGILTIGLCAHASTPDDIDEAYREGFAAGAAAKDFCDAKCNEAGGDQNVR